MVRILAGTLLQVGMGEREPEEMAETEEPGGEFEEEEEAPSHGWEMTMAM